MEEGFDFSVTQEFGVDHAMLVPLHYLTDDVKTPVVPIWVNTFSAPLPKARRCYALGRMLKDAVDSLPQNLRVAVLATGSFSLEIGGPKIDPASATAFPISNGRSTCIAASATAEFDEIVRGHAGADVEGRQYRRRAAELGGAARHGRQGQAALSGSTRREGRPRLCGLALELSGEWKMSAYQINKLCHRVYHDIPSAKR